MAAAHTFGKAIITGGDATGLSGTVSTTGAVAIWIDVPTWTDSAAITFQVQAEEEGTFLDAYDEIGNEITLPASTHNRSYSVPALIGAFAIKVRSGVSGTAVQQTATETVTVFGLR